MAIYVGSARIDENGHASGGKAGDQTGKEVAQQVMYKHSLGWYIIRPKSASVASKLAKKMIAACDNANLGYDQSNRLGVITYGIETTTKTECDCSSLVRACVKECTSKDPGNFSTSGEKAALLATGLFDDKGSYVDQSTTPVYNGDILVTKTKGHTVIVTKGSARPSSSTTLKYKLTGNVNIRKGTGTNYGIIKVARKGETVEVSKITSNNWGYVPAVKGYISLNTKYTVKV